MACGCACTHLKAGLGFAQQLKEEFFSPQCVPLGCLVLTSFPGDALKELLLTLPFSLNSFDF